jgi:putative tricarboxylic transport membrane protein
LFLATALVAGGMALGFPAAAPGIPGPAVAPLLFAGPLAVLALVLIWRGWRQQEGSLPGAAGPPSAATVPARDLQVRLALLIAAMALYAALMPLLGFIAASTLFIFVCLRLFNYHNAVRALAFALLTAFILHLVFALVMGVPLPRGWIG